MSLYDLKKQYAYITAFYALTLTEYQMHTHTHPRCEIMYVTKGRCKIYVGSEEFILGSRQFIFLDADVPHRLLIENGTLCSILNLEFSCHEDKMLLNLDLQELQNESSSFRRFCQKKDPYLLGTDTENLGYALKDLISQLKKNLNPEMLYMDRQKHISEREYAGRLSSDQFYFIRLLFCRAMLELALCGQSSSAPAGTVYLKRALAYIDAHLTEELRIPQIAAYAGINKSYLHSLFSQQLGCTITDYINSRRLEQAAFLLINSSLPVTDIAFQTGYNSRQHFSSTFEKYYGLSPRAYRQLHEKQINPTTGSGQLRLGESGVWETIKMRE